MPNNIQKQTIFNNCNRYVEKKKRTITKIGLNNSAATLLQAGDLILSARGTVGVLALIVLNILLCMSFAI